MRLNEKNAVIIGGGAGLGRAIAQAFAAEGARVAVADLNLAGAQETLRIAGARNGLAFRLDVSNAAEVRSVIDDAAQQLGRVDIVVNCAAIFLVDQPLE